MQPPCLAMWIVRLTHMRRLSTLSLVEKQLVQFVRSLVGNPEILIVDELTAGLNAVECQRIFDILLESKRMGKCILYISHKISDVMKVCDKVTVLRKGEVVASLDTSQIKENQLIKLMLGHALPKQYPKLPVSPGKEVLRVRNLCTDFLMDINFSLMEGEILGIAGLLGSGRTSLVRSIAGLKEIRNGEIQFLTRNMHLSTSDKILGIIPENRTQHGLFENLSLAKNITISNLKKILHNKLISDNSESVYARDMVDRIGVVNPGIKLPVEFLSSGNKQKAIVARCVFSRAKIFIFDEPTKDVDLSGKVEMYNIMNEIARKGSSVILVSSDFSELVGMCDRIIILCDGRQVTELSREEVTKELLYSYCNNPKVN